MASDHEMLKRAGDYELINKNTMDTNGKRHGDTEYQLYLQYSGMAEIDSDHLYEIYNDSRSRIEKRHEYQDAKANWMHERAAKEKALRESQQPKLDDWREAQRKKALTEYHAAGAFNKVQLDSFRARYQHVLSKAELDQIATNSRAYLGYQFWGGIA